MTTLLTGQRELDFKIMLNLDARALGQICVTNKYAEDICQDPYFWELRFKGYIIETFPLKDGLTDYLNSLNALEDADKHAKMILMIAKIEKNRKKKPTNGVIYIKNDIHALFNFIGDYFFVKIASNNMQLIQYSKILTLESISETEYELKIILDNLQKVIILTNLEAEQFLAYVLYFDDYGVIKTIIVDQNNINYGPFIGNYDRIVDRNQREAFILRQGIWDALNYF